MFLYYNVSMMKKSEFLKSTILPDKVMKIARAVKAKNGRALLVGGYVRDLILNKFGYQVEPKDPDIEIYQIEADRLRELLKRFGPVDEVGAVFSVFKVGEIDVAIPRRDSKISAGHRGFMVEGEPDMSFAEATKRRDFTMNAIGLDPLTGEVFDEHDGVEHIKQKIIQSIIKYC